MINSQTRQHNRYKPIISTFLLRLVPLYHRINESGTWRKFFRHLTNMLTKCGTAIPILKWRRKVVNLWQCVRRSDPTEREYNDFVSTMPWSRSRIWPHRRERLRRGFGVSRLPTLMIVNAKDSVYECSIEYLPRVYIKKPTGFPWGELTISPKGGHFERTSSSTAWPVRGVRAWCSSAKRENFNRISQMLLHHSLYHCALECDE